MLGHQTSPPLPAASRVRVAVALLWILAGALVPSRAAAQGIANGGFEGGTLTPWVSTLEDCARNGVFENCAGWVASAADAHTGRWSARGDGLWQLRQDFAPVPVGSIRSFSLWMREPDNAWLGQPAVGDFVFFYADGSASTFVQWWDTPAQWTYVDLTRALEPAKALTGFGISGEIIVSPVVRGATFYVDDVALATTPEPTALALVGVGLLALGAVVRRRRF